MKRFVSTFILLLFVVASAAAQSTNSIIINQDSFRAIQSDELTGLILDPIGQDHSRRPCARIKMRINRMTAEQINELQLEIITNNELTRFQTATASNGLIIEMTAKSQSRFYLKHSKFGYSNEVMLNLEGNKEYYIEAELVQQFPITIATNVANADIYINNQYKGTSNDNFYLIVEDMLAGDYDLSLKYAGKEYTQKIKVTTSSVYFKQDVELNRVTTQYLIVSPKLSTANFLVIAGFLSFLHTYLQLSTGYPLFYPHPMWITLFIHRQKVMSRTLLLCNTFVTHPMNLRHFLSLH